MEIQKNESTDAIDFCQSSMCDDLVKELIQSGVDLKNYSQNVNKQLKKVENACVGDYISESSNIAHLHQQINESDKILEKIEGMLCAFQADLGNICQEILTLQEQSVNLNIKLKNKLELQKELSQYIDDIVVPQAVISAILNCAPHEKEFINQLQVLHQKIFFVKDQSFNDSKSCKDVMDALDNLKIKAIIKINDYIIKKIQLFRKPMSNYQVLQAAILQKKFFFQFLIKHNREVAKEIQYEYIDTLSKVYFSYFKEYLSRLDKLKFEELADKDDLMAADDSNKSKMVFFSGKHILKNKSTVFTLGNRATVIKEELESDIIVPHLAQKNETKFTIESIFRSIQYAIIEHACREHYFISNFFSKKNPIIQEIFINIFQKTLQLVLKKVEDEFSNSYDSIGLFLCLQIIYRFRLICHKRIVPSLDEYWNSLINILWIRFEFLLQLQIQSLKTCDINKISNCDTRPHYITRRYAEFSAAIITINDTFPDERVSIYLGNLHTEIENLILKLASKFNTPKEQLIFLINNSDMILCVLIEKTKEKSRESEKIKQQINKRIQDFVEEMLYPNFGEMISFVKDCESYTEKNDQDALLKEGEKILPIIKNFNNTWKEAIEDINKEILNNFTNFNCGNEIKMSTLMKMVQYYHKFHQIVSSDPLKSNPARSLLMNIHQLMLEIKKYKINY